jgi:5-methylcytosine-specific restriction endonuclease McrA|tara:strand:+ start:1875 stop:2306 length:432 start_codon:yes stop_codon:yes gene_type:complete
MPIQMKKNKSWLVEPECINDGCGNKVHTRRINKNRTRDVRSECYKCHLGGRKRPGVTPHKKEYCENIDGRLGFECTATIIDGCQLDLDHIDGDRWHNVPENVQTLCGNCHSMKTKFSGDSRNNKQSKTLEEFKESSTLVAYFK